LNAIPEKAKDDERDLPQQSRLQAMRAAWVPDWVDEVPAWVTEAMREDYMPDMPDIEVGRYLLDYLLEVGPTIAGGTSQGPVTNDELAHWQQNSGMHLAPWESQTLLRLSKDYLAEALLAKQRDRPAPWQIPGEKPPVTETQAALRALSKL
jgi:hypothetical protein